MYCVSYEGKRQDPRRSEWIFTDAPLSVPTSRRNVKSVPGAARTSIIVRREARYTKTMIKTVPEKKGT